MPQKMKFLKPEQTDEIWVQKDGTGIPVGQMEEHHLRNALRKMIRWRTELYDQTNKLLTDGYEEGD